MKIPSKLNEKQSIYPQLAKIIKLYGNSTITDLLNDLVAIGTWPTPERPFTGKRPVKAGKGSVAIDTVPLPEKPKKLKKLIRTAIKIGGRKRLRVLLKK